MRFARNLLKTEPVGSNIKGELLPGSDKVSDDELAAFCAKTVKTNYHPSGSARMGRDDDPMAVLDTQMRVRGVFDPRWLLNPAKVFPLDGRVAA